MAVMMKPTTLWDVYRRAAARVKADRFIKECKLYRRTMFARGQWIDGRYHTEFGSVGP